MLMNAETLAQTIAQSILDTFFNAGISGTAEARGSKVFFTAEKEGVTKACRVDFKQEGVKDNALNYSLTVTEITACPNCLCFNCIVQHCPVCQSCNAEEIDVIPSCTDCKEEERASQ